ncbi:hypothetical protein ACRRTK_023298 [Alexandromys fortis]
MKGHPPAVSRGATHATPQRATRDGCLLAWPTSENMSTHDSPQCRDSEARKEPGWHGFLPGSQGVLLCRCESRNGVSEVDSHGPSCTLPFPLAHQ